MAAKPTPITSDVPDESAPPVERLTADEVADLTATDAELTARRAAVNAAIQALHEATGAANYVRFKVRHRYALSDADRVEDDGTITRAPQ